MFWDLKIMDNGWLVLPKGRPLAPDVLLLVDESVRRPGHLLLGGVALDTPPGVGVVCPPPELCLTPSPLTVNGLIVPGLITAALTLRVDILGLSGLTLTTKQF